MDRNSGFLVSYSYCEISDECLMDAWNYINRDCASSWRLGEDYELNLCYPQKTVCQEVFVSSQEKFGTYDNLTWTLPQGAYCDIVVDATAAVGRVIFDETSFLGVDGTDIKLGEVITVDQGQVKNITIYNAASTGPLTFLISFSGAIQLGAVALATALMVSIAL
jgi:hypothetical protein